MLSRLEMIDYECNYWIVLLRCYTINENSLEVKRVKDRISGLMSLFIEEYNKENDHEVEIKKAA